jgi:N-acetylmuramoyl-L-alanine amidase
MKFNKNIVAILLAGIVMLLLYVKIPLYASAETITSQNTRGYIDNPVSGTTLIGTHNISGWFLDVSGVKKIDVLVDGAVAGQAVYGDARSDVQKAFPQYNNGTAGFHYALDTTKFSDGQHTVTIRATGKNSRVTTLPNSIITIQNTRGYIDNPVSGTTLIGTHNISGWFLDVSGVKKIDVLVDGAVAGQAVYGDARSDVKKAFPHYNNGTAGFHYALDSTRFTNGQHAVTIRVTGMSGRVTALPNSTITVNNENTRGYMDNPVSGTTLKGIQNVSGWFLDVSGVKKIDVLVDGTVAGQAAYGDARPDVKKAFPQYNNGTAGFHYALDSTRFTNGQHAVTIRVTGMSGRVTALPNSTITVNNENTRGYMDNPVSGTTLKGIQNVSGWFLDVSGVKKIDVLVDGTVAGQAAYGDARPDVKKAFPQYNNGTAGFHYALDTTIFSDGQHTVTIRVTGKNGRVTNLPNSTITIKNENAIWYLDNPISGTTLRGTKNVSGWFLNKSGVENIDVLVDGAVAGQATYGDARSDVKKAFPQYNNGTAGFHYALDTTQFTVGKHTITIRVTGKNGRVTTLPSSTVMFNQSRTLFLDPGHGGSDPGATAGGYKEADLNLAVAKKVQSLLLDRGYTVYMSRNNNTTLSLLDRSQMANDIETDIFVSIHTNSTAGGETTANGIESYYYEYDANYPSKINGDLHNNPERISKSVKLTNLIQDNLIEYTGAKDRGTDGETFSVVRESAMPATLIEMGFINNSSERKKLVTDSYQNIIAKAIADGIDEYFNIY